MPPVTDPKISAPVDLLSILDCEVANEIVFPLNDPPALKVMVAIVVPAGAV